MLMPQAVNCPIRNIGTHKNTNKKKKERKILWLPQLAFEYYYSLSINPQILEH